jgi:hypothetical protein
MQLCALLKFGLVSEERRLVSRHLANAKLMICNNNMYANALNAIQLYI